MASSLSSLVTEADRSAPLITSGQLPLADYQRKVPTRPNSRGTVLEIVE